MSLDHPQTLSDYQERCRVLEMALDRDVNAQQLAAAQAEAAKWERIATALMEGQLQIQSANSTLAIANGIMGIELPPPSEGFRWLGENAVGKWKDTPREALLAWDAEQQRKEQT